MRQFVGLLRRADRARSRTHDVDTHASTIELSLGKTQRTTNPSPSIVTACPVGVAENRIHGVAALSSPSLATAERIEPRMIKAYLR